MMSVTANHVVLGLSFAFTFFICYVGSQLLSSVLNDAGYDLLGTILGIEKRPGNMTSQQVRDFSNNQFAQLLAVALTAVTTVVLFWKFSKSMSSPADACDEADMYSQSRRNRCWILKIGKNSRS